MSHLTFTINIIVIISVLSLTAANDHLLALSACLSVCLSLIISCKRGQFVDLSNCRHSLHITLEMIYFHIQDVRDYLLFFIS